MGNNQAYEIWEATIIEVWNAGVLDRPLLESLSKIHKGTDIDSGGSQDLRSKDGLDVEEITLKLYGKEVPVAPDLPKDYKTWTPEQELLNDEYWDKRYELFHEIADQIWGWR